MKNPDLVTQALLVVLILVVGWMAFHGGPTTQPAAPAPAQQPSDLAAAAAQHHRTEGALHANVAAWLRSGQITRRDQGFAAFKAHEKPYGDALNAAWDACCDKDGNVVDAPRLATWHDQAASAVGNK